MGDQTSRTLMLAEALAGWDDADFGREMAQEEQGERSKRSRRAAPAPPSPSSPPPSSPLPPSAAPPKHPLRALVGLALRPLSGRSDDTSRPDARPSSAALATPPKSEAPRRRAAAPAAPPPSSAARRRGGQRPTTADSLASHPPTAAASSSSSSGSDDDEDDNHKYDRRQPYRHRLSIRDAPDYVHFPFLLGGYRAGGGYGRNLRALFEWHTETLNAWTMIAGVALSVWQLVIALRGGSSGSSSSSGGASPGGFLVRPPQSWREALPFVALTLSCAAHAPFSVGFHLFRGMSPHVYNLWRRLDQAFIFLASVPMAWALAAWAQGGPFDGGVLSAAAAVGQQPDAPHWSGSPAARATFGVAALVACWATAVIASLKPGFRRDKRQMVLFVGTIVACYWAPMAATALEDVLRWRRHQQRSSGGGGAWAAAAAFSSHHPHHSALFAAAAPLPLGTGPSGSSTTHPSPLVLYHGLGAARAALGVLLSLLLGAAFYATGWPERRWPGRFDLVGSSHQLMHVAVVSAHAFKHAFLRELWRRRCVEEALLLGGGGVKAAAAVGRVLSLRAALGRGAALAVALLSDALGAAAAALEGALRRPAPLVSGLSPATLAGVCVAAAVLLRAQQQRRKAGAEAAAARRSAGLVAASSSGGGGEVHKPSPPRPSCEIVPSSASSSGCGDKLLFEAAVASA